MRKENMYNINKRGRKKNQQILLGDFAGVLTSLVHRREWGVGVDLVSFSFFNSSRTNLVRGPGHKAKLVPPPPIRFSVKSIYRNIWKMWNSNPHIDSKRECFCLTTC
jgi:hypothetical protein